MTSADFFSAKPIVLHSADQGAANKSKPEPKHDPRASHEIKQGKVRVSSCICFVYEEKDRELPCGQARAPAWSRAYAIGFGFSQLVPMPSVRFAGGPLPTE